MQQSHRKLRTVAGNVADGDDPIGGRQTARDLFDIYVLSHAHMPIKEFMPTLPYTFPESAFTTGMVSMPWYELIDDLEGIKCDPKWDMAKNIEVLQSDLLDQVGAKLLVEPLEEDHTQEIKIDSEPVKPETKKKPWWRFGK